jgi:ferric-dicitrate binding protein FerR (iron transport regulator)
MHSKPLCKRSRVMKEQHIIIGKILAQYPAISELDQEILNKWLEESEDHKQLLQSLTNENDRGQLLDRYVQMKKEEGQEWDQLVRMVGEVPKKRRIGGWNSWKNYAVAASIIVLLSISAYIWWGRKKQIDIASTEVPKNEVNDAAPGKFKAKLILSDGREVILDSTPNGVLAKQGTTEIRSEDGKLVYKSNTKNNEVLYNTLSTSKGETFSTVLADGSRIWLNSQSSIKYPVSFAGQRKREVEITGEAYFEIAHSGLPFITRGNSSTHWKVEVLGTHYNINSYGDQGAVKATLLEGKVKVISEAEGKEKIAILSPGQQAQISTNNIKVENNPDLEKVVAWKNGLFFYNGDDVETVMAELARWYDLKVEYKGTVKKKFYAVVGRDEPISTLLTMFEKSGTGHFKLEGKTIVVSP